MLNARDVLRAGHRGRRQGARAPGRPRRARGRPARRHVPVRPVPAEDGADARADLDAGLRRRAVERPHRDRRRQGGARRRAVPEHRRGRVRARGAGAGARAGRARRARSGSCEASLHAVPLRPRRTTGGPRERGEDGAAAAATHQRRRLRRPASGPAEAGPGGSSDETRRHAREGCGGCCSTTARSSRMDAERRILRDAAIAVEGNSIAAVGKSERDPRRATPTSPCATCTAGSSRRASSTATSTCRRRSCAAAATRCRCGSGWRSGSSSSRARSRAEDVTHLDAPGGARDAQGGHDGVPRDADPRPPRRSTTWPRRWPAPGCAPCCRAAITDGGGYLDESPLSAGLTRRPRRRSPTRSRSPSSPRLRAVRVWFGPRSTGGMLRGAAARARRRSPARRAWACASTTP